MGTTPGTPSPVVSPALTVIDRTVFVGVPVIVAGTAISFPAGAQTPLRMLAALLLAAWGLALLGRLGHAPWRRFLYPIVVLCIAVLGFSTQGPTAGVGAALGLSVLLAGALSSRGGLWLFVAAAIAAIALAPGELRNLTFDEPSVWIRISLAVAVQTWIATLVLAKLIQTLELSYDLAVDAYRNETEMRMQLDNSRSQLDEAEHVELVGRLAGGVAHDINNALTAILAASDLLGDKVDTAGQREDLARLEEASRQAAELVRDLLWIGRQFPPTTTAAQVDGTVRACLRRLERMGRKIDVAVHVPVLCVALAPERLEQVLFRVILRAQRAGVTQLAVTAHRTGSTIEIELRGTECSGSPSANLFARPKAVTARLGMSAAKQVVEQAGGSLTITEGDNQLFVQLSLPAAEDPRPLELTGLDRARTALVVDDEPLVLRRLSTLVARRGYTVMSASSLAEAWPMLAKAPDLLVTDLQLGDGRGEELALASFESDPDRPIVICSGFGADDALREQLRTAQIWFLTKPFTMAELDDAIPRTKAAA